MSEKIYAHTSGKSQDTSQDNWQTLEDHQQETADKASCFAQRFDSADWAWNAAWLHDLGKIDPRFQNKLRKANGLESENEDESLPGSVNHSGAGAAYAEEKFKGFVGRTLAYLIIGHHAGLPDYQSDLTGNAAFVCRMKEAEENLISGYISSSQESVPI